MKEWSYTNPNTFNYNVTKAFRSGSLIDDAISFVVSQAKMAVKIAQHVINNVR